MSWYSEKVYKHLLNQRSLFKQQENFLSKLTLFDVSIFNANFEIEGNKKNMNYLVLFKSFFYQLWIAERKLCKT